ncbi:MAG TPA: hypothetical protein PKX80_09925 [Flexilinea sp.]|nr:hypothetical protein [Flexilinea sp.]HPS47199.1 hypothetical protein [Flexilinea sp.]HQG89819.1 hypothetical protein [Flexilinea sp.]HQJ01847.1 hypothetical protein [Flexilinea sp.]
MNGIKNLIKEKNIFGRSDTEKETCSNGINFTDQYRQTVLPVFYYLFTFNPILYDANGNRLPDPDQETQRELWKYEDSLRNHLSEGDNFKYIGTMHTFTIPKSGIIFPVYAKQNVYERSFPEKEAFAQIEFNLNRIQPANLPFHVNQHIQIGSIDFILETVEKKPNGGYSFLFDGTDNKVIQCQIDPIGYETNLKGSSSFNPDNPFHFRQELFFQGNPSEKISIRISQPAVLGDLISFIGSWSPQE